VRAKGCEHRDAPKVGGHEVPELGPNSGAHKSLARPVYF
jgi:hypothetical protein